MARLHSHRDIHMEMAFDIRRSNKSGINSQEHFIVVRGDTVFLRVIGREMDYILVTATAGEDTGQFHPYKDKKRLAQAALRTASLLKTPSCRMVDRKNREFTFICGFHFVSDAYRVSELLFEFLNGYSADDTSQLAEMREIYNALAIDDTGEDIYLSDGVWLGRDGGLFDRGR